MKRIDWRFEKKCWRKAVAPRTPSGKQNGSDKAIRTILRLHGLRANKYGVRQ